MRKYYLDNLRLITVCLVVIYHVIFMYNGVIHDIVIGREQVIPVLDGIQYVLYPWFMVLLFMISGMCSRYYLESHTKKDFLKSRTRKLLIPSTLGVLVFGWIQGYISMSITGAFLFFPESMPKAILYLIMTLSGIGVLWFAQVLWLESVLLFLIQKWEKGRLYAKTRNAGVVCFLIGGVLYYFAGQILNAPMISVYRFGIDSYVFFLGYFVLAHDEVIEKLSKWAWILFGIAVILASVYLHYHFGDNYATMPVVGSVSASAYGYICCLAILGLGKKYLGHMNAVASYMNKRSFALYVFHYPLLSGMALVMERYGDIPQVFRYVILIFIAFAGSFLLYEVVRRIPILRYLILGMSRNAYERSS